jgi:hypothetical protein
MKIARNVVFVWNYVLNSTTHFFNHSKICIRNFCMRNIFSWAKFLTRQMGFCFRRWTKTRFSLVIRLLCSKLLLVHRSHWHLKKVLFLLLCQVRVFQVIKIRLRWLIYCYPFQLSLTRLTLSILHLLGFSVHGLPSRENCLHFLA